MPQTTVAALGALKHRAIFSPLFSAFGPQPVKQRLQIGQAKVLVTTTKLYQRKVLPIRKEVPDLQHVILVDAEGSGDGVYAWEALLAGAESTYPIGPTDPETPALLHFTSGTTGTPKGALHVHEAVVMHCLTGSVALDLRDEDVYWCTADPGWVTGTSYGIVAPLVHGVTMVMDEADFDAERWYDILASEKVSVWYTAPTAIRMLMRAGDEIPRRYDLSALRFAASVGEPLNPEGVVWGKEVLGRPFHDNWWQTETGGIVVANYASLDIRPGSMGKPMPGMHVALVHHQENGSVEVVEGADQEGELAIRTPWPSMFRAYWNNEERYRKSFADGWYLSGDLAKRDADGYYYFVGRSDDVIKTAGHLIGPFEVESALIEHPAVAEAGVIGKPDPVAGTIIKAFVALKPDYDDQRGSLGKELLGFARKRLGSAVAPREIAIVDDLPKTRSGKIMRRLLKARELGLPEGDTSTLEGPSEDA